MATETKTLVGPPGMYDPCLLDTSFSATCTLTDVVEHRDRQKEPIYTEPVKGCTLFDSATYLSTGDPCLDFFFHVVPDTPAEVVVARLDVAWEKDPLTALKLVCNLRGVRGTGKADREGFYSSAIWLHENHPKTLALNLRSMVEFGYLKDLLEILYRILNGPDCRSNSGPQHRRCMFESDSKEGRYMRRKRKRVENVYRAISRYAHDDHYQFLHDRVAELFAELLSADMKHLESGETNRLGLAAKWCPSLDSSFDKETLICESIARRIFPRDSVPVYATLSDKHYAYRVRSRLRKEVLTPLREALNLPERYMSAGRWESVDYSRVSSLAMKRHKDAFLEHDELRATTFLDNVGAGTVRLPVGALHPHEILQKAYKGVEDELEDAQWAALIAGLAKQGKFRSSIAMCSSGMMSGKAAEVSAALSLLISELSEDPWKGRVITLGKKPKWHTIDGSSVKERIKFARNSDSEFNGSDESGPDIVAVFDEILSLATDRKLPAENMVKRVFIFSDMQFQNNRSGSEDMTDYEVIHNMFKGSGYGSVVPEIVFWNLGSSNCTPVLGKQNGVALLSGYSKNLLRLFLEMDGKIAPEVLMADAISGAEYQNLEVFD